MVAAVATVLLAVSPGHPARWVSSHAYRDVDVASVRVDGVEADAIDRVGDVFYFYGRGCVVRLTQGRHGKLRVRALTASRDARQLRIRYSATAK